MGAHEEGVAGWVAFVVGELVVDGLALVGATEVGTDVAGREPDGVVAVGDTDGPAAGGAEEQAAATAVTAAARTAQLMVDGRRRLGLWRIVRAYRCRVDVLSLAVRTRRTGTLPL